MSKILYNTSQMDRRHEMLMSINVRLVHGVRTKDGGKKAFGDLKKHLMSLLHNSDVSIISYGYIFVPISNKRAVAAIIDELEKVKHSSSPITVIAHSNGCWASVQAAEIGHRVDHLVLINPALHKAHAFPEHVKRIDVYHAPNDIIVSMGKWYRRFVNTLPWNWGAGKHGWGEMGRTGYIGQDDRVVNHDMGYVGHSWYNTETVAKMIANDINMLYEDKEFINSLTLKGISNDYCPTSIF